MQTKIRRRRDPEASDPAHDDHAYLDLSVVIPVFNEEDNVERLAGEISDVLKGTDLTFEVIFVDDGSTDRSLERLFGIARNDERVVVIELRRNFGQTAAMAAGIDYASGAVIVPLDADLQNDPSDIPKLLEKLNGQPPFDIVSGWRRKRQDRWLTRVLPSVLANAIIRRVTRVPIHDFGCTLKAYRREILQDLTLSSDLHRFLPALAAWQGARIGEVSVNHRPRKHGKTKYGLLRTLRVVLDFVTVTFLGGYVTKPLYFFGKLGAITLALALTLLALAVGQKYGYFGQPDGLNLNRNILVSLSALLAFLTVQCILLGVLAELLIRIYHDIKNRPIYRTRCVYCSKSIPLDPANEVEGALGREPLKYRPDSVPAPAHR